MLTINKALLMYVHYFPYMNVTYDTSHYLFRIAFKSAENQISFNDELSRTCLLLRMNFSLRSDMNMPPYRNQS